MISSALRAAYQTAFPNDPLQGERLVVEGGGGLLWLRDIDAHLVALRTGKLTTSADRGQGVVDTTNETIARLEKLRLIAKQPSV